MKIIQYTQLRFTEGNSDKVYEVDLCEHPRNTDAERFIVNFRYGAYGKKMREGTKTTEPVTHEKAIKIFDSLVVSKVNKGYESVDTKYPTGADASEQLDADDITFAALETNSAKNTIINHLFNPPKKWPLSRIVWRAGDFDLVEAGDKILEIATAAKKRTENDEEASLLLYSCVWALASCGQAHHLPVLQTLQNDTKTKRLNLSVQLMLADDKDKKQVANQLLTQLPKEIAESILSDDLDSVATHLKVLAQQIHINKARFWYESDTSTFPKENVDIILAAYQLSYYFPICKAAIMQVMDEELKTVHFDLIKQLFKFSQLYRDSETFAKAAKLIHGLRPECEDNYSQNTLGYYRRRSWRSIRKLGEADNTAYADFAEAILLTVKDAESKKPETVEYYTWDYESRSNKQYIKHYGRFAKLVAFNHILYENSNRIKQGSGLKWTIDKEVKDTERTEAFANLWDKAPERLLNLLLKGLCEEVHCFAIQALRDNERFCATLADERINQLEKLLTSQYDVTAQFALEFAQNAYAKSASLSLISLSLIKACLTAQYAPAKQQALQWIKESPNCLKADFSLYALAVFYSIDIDELASCIASIKLTDDEQKQLVNAVISDVKNRETVSTEQLKYVLSQLIKLANDAVKNLPMHQIDELLSKSIEHNQLFGALLLLENNIAIADIPVKILTRINQSDSEVVRATAISLLKKLTDAELLDKYEFLFSLVVSDQQLMREAVQPILKRLKNNAELTKRLLADLVPYVFRAEHIEGFHDDVLTLCETTLYDAVANMDSKLRWRLLRAQSKTGKKLGAMQIEQLNIDTYSIKQWAFLGANEMLSVRQYVWTLYADNISLIRENMNDALRLLNNKWDDSREFALGYFRQQLAETDWTADLIVGICDSTFDDVQLLGRELLTRCFKEGDGVQYLMQLSQHPTQNVQLFTTNFLADYASDSLERLKMLKPYFITVLSHVFKGRIAKNRVIKFLNKEALKNEQVAHFVAEIYTRQSVSVAITDKAQYIESMQALRAVYPTLDLPIQIKSLAIKGKSHNGKSSQELFYEV